ncbi:CBS domain-containing protein [Streptomyces sediminimaris]|uniref:CBS domain-containing protein n=1 Tax=Streptomyces sediminimaris TaxID=3383721 RepID=UPI00399C18D8
MRYRRIKDVMTHDVVRAGRETPFKQVARLLSEHGISGLPVVDDGRKVLGVISETDLLQHQVQRQEGRGRRRLRLPKPTRTARAAAAKARARTAEHLMTRPVLTATPEEYVTEAARTMWEHRVERLPVVDDEGRLVGIVTRGDLLRVFLRTDQEVRRDVIEQVTRGLGLPRHAVDVVVDAGVVTLRGHLERRADAELAALIAAHVDGVVAVTDRLTHRPAPARPPRAGGLSSLSGHM